MPTGMHVSVTDLTVTVNSKDKAPKHLLQSVTFVAEPGDVIALMGPSGAGKTTLLNRLVGRGIKGDVDGSATYSGHCLKDARSCIGYVTQDDIMYETLTPRENLTFAACFALSHLSRSERCKAVEDIMDKLRLGKCADTVVGTPGLVRGISGGERKRTNVAMSLLGQPSLLLMDEPTSGLDSKMAAELMVDVGEVAKQGCTVIATIHQPSDEVFHKFNKVLLLESGRIAYFGLVSGLRQKLADLGFPAQEQMPLPEMLLDILEIPDDMVETPEAHMVRLAQLRMQSSPPQFVSTDAPEAEGAPLNLPEPQALPPSHRLPFLGQLWALFCRSALDLRRNKTLTLVRTGQTVLSAIGISWIFFDLGTSLADVNARLFVTFLLAFSQFLFALLGVVNTFPAERAVFLREAQDCWYNPAAFYIAKVVLDTIMQCIFPVFVTAIGYAMVGLNANEAERILMFYVIMAILANAGSGMGFIVSAAVSNVSTALSIAPGLVMPQLLLAGLFIKIENLPQPFHALSYVMVARYAIQALVNNEFACEDTPECDVTWRTKGGDSCAHSPCDICCTSDELAVSAGICPLLTCDDALRFLGLDARSIWPAGDTVTGTVGWNVLALIILLVFFRLVGLLVLMLIYRKASFTG